MTKRKDPKDLLPMGQPTKYKPEYCAELLEYFSQPPYDDIKIEHYKWHTVNKDGKKVQEQYVAWTDIKRMPRALPTLMNFARNIGVSIATVYNWADPKHGSYQPDFLDALTRAREYRKWFIIENGLQGHYPAIFAKFVALNITDMVDSVPGGSGDGVDSLADIAALFAARVAAGIANTRHAIIRKAVESAEVIDAEAD